MFDVEKIIQMVSELEALSQKMNPVQKALFTTPPWFRLFLTQLLEKLGELTRVHSESFEIIAHIKDAEELIIQAWDANLMELIVKLNMLAVILAKLNGLVKGGRKNEESLFAN